MQFTLSTAVVALAVLIGTAAGETHTVHLQNNCCSGTNQPTLIVGDPSQGPSTNADFVFNGPLTDTVAFLQTGFCSPNGENCTVVQLALVNGDESGAQSSANVDLSFSRVFSIPTGFSFSNGCDGSGANCSDKECPAVNVVVGCRVNDVDLTITFCDLDTA
ncbi:hypothetical protein V8D89_003147 [Ganoderma adspersum]